MKVTGNDVRIKGVEPAEMTDDLFEIPLISQILHITEILTRKKDVIVEDGESILKFPSQSEDFRGTGELDF
jgi:hypothetical protein